MSAPSLRLRLAASLTLTTLLVALVAGIAAYHAIHDEAHDYQDDILRQTALLIDPNNPPPRADLDDDNRIDIETVSRTGRYGRFLGKKPGDGYHDLRRHDRPYRAYLHTYPDGQRLALIQDTESRDQIASASAWHATLRRENRFIADAAHELRTPMTALTLQAERLAPYMNDPAASAQLDTLRTGIRRTAALLEQLLLLARSQHTEAAAPATSRVQDTYRQIIETLLPLADRKHSDLGIASEQDATLPVPAAELYTLGKNLADNALRYSPPGSRIDLDLETSADAITLIVEDNGPGIAADERARVLDPFYRQLGSEEEGTGLGLAIVKSLCDKHGATLSLRDAKNHAHGLRVEIRFPR